MKTQYEVFSATMDNFSKAVEANEVALSSSGSAMQENEKYMKGLDAQTNILKATWNDLINNTLNSETIGSILSIATGFLEWTDNMGGLIPVLGLVIGLIASLNAKLIVTGAIALFDVISKIGHFIANFKLATVNLTAFNLVMGTTVTKTQLASVALGALGIVITATIGAMMAFDAHQKELMQNTIDVNNEVNAEISSLESLLEKVNDSNTSMEEQNSILDGLIKKYPGITSEIDDDTGAREKNIEAIEGQTEALINHAIAEGQEGYNTALQRLPDGFSAKSDSSVSFGGELDDIINSKTVRSGSGKTKRWDVEYTLDLDYDTIDSDIATIEAKIAELSIIPTDQLTDEQKEQKQILQGIISDYNGYSDELGVIAEQSSVLADKAIMESEKLSSMEDMIKEGVLQDWSDGFISSQAEAMGYTADVAHAIEENMRELAVQYQDSGNEVVDTNNEIVESEEDLDDNIKDVTNQFDNLKKKLEVSSDALDDYNDYGGMTSKTLSDLQGQFPDLYSAFFNLDGSLNSAGQSAFDTAGDVYGLITAYRQLKAELALGNLKEASAGQDRIVYDKAYKEYWQAVQELEGWEKQAVELRKRAATSTGGGGGGGGGGSAKDPLEEQSDIFKEQIEILEHELFLQEQIEGTEQEQIEINKKLQALVAQQADWYRSKGLDNTSEYIRDLQKQWWGYYDDIKSLEESITEIKEEEAKKQLEIAQDLIDKQTSALKKEKSDMETAFSYLSQIINEQIQLAQDEMDAIDEALQKEVDALKEENDVLNEQIALEEKLEALAKAKAQRKLVYQNGQFVYSQDYDAISSAQDELDTYNREQALEEEIAELKANAEIEKGLLKKKIARWQEYLDSYSGIVDDYELEQDRLIAEHILETQLEQDNWDIRLSQAQEFADRYNSIMSTLSAVATASEDISSGGTSSRDDIIAQMKANSQAWFDADDETKEALHQANDELNALLGGTSSDYNGSTGEWSTLASGSDVSSTIGSSVSSNDLLYPGTSTPNVSSYTNTSSSSSVSTTFNNAVFNVPNEATMDSLLSTLPEASRATSYSR